MPDICAICGNDIAGKRLPMRMAPLGRDDAMVKVCTPCDTEAPIATTGPKLDFVPDRPDVGSGNLQQRARARRSAKP